MKTTAQYILIGGLILIALTFLGNLEGSALAQGTNSFDLRSLTLRTPGGVQGESWMSHPKGPVIGFILLATDILVKIVGSLAFLALVLSGIWMIISYGDEQQLTKAKGIMTWAILGLVFVLAAFFLVTFVQQFFIV